MVYLPTFGWIFMVNLGKYTSPMDGFSDIHPGKSKAGTAKHWVWLVQIRFSWLQLDRQFFLGAMWIFRGGSEVCRFGSCFSQVFFVWFIRENHPFLRVLYRWNGWNYGASYADPIFFQKDSAWLQVEPYWSSFAGILKQTKTRPQNVFG